MEDACDFAIQELFLEEKLCIYVYTYFLQVISFAIKVLHSMYLWISSYIFDVVAAVTALLKAGEHKTLFFFFFCLLFFAVNSK